VKRAAGCLGVAALVMLTTLAWLIGGFALLVFTMSTDDAPVPPDSALVLPAGFTTVSVTDCDGSHCGTRGFKLSVPPRSPTDVGQQLVSSLKAAKWTPDPVRPVGYRGEVEVHASMGPFDVMYSWTSENDAPVTQVTADLDFVSDEAGNAYLRDHENWWLLTVFIGVPVLLTGASIWGISKLVRDRPRRTSSV
jgi:hypothetical protein